MITEPLILSVQGNQSIGSVLKRCASLYNFDSNLNTGCGLYDQASVFKTGLKPTLVVIKR